MNKKNELKRIIIKNICQHVKTDILLSDKLTLILAGNGTGKSIFTESICLKPSSEKLWNDNDKNRIDNLLKFWDKKEKKSKISFKYIDENNESKTKSLIIDKNKNLKWTKNTTSSFEPKIEFFNENSTYEDITRNYNGQELINLSKEMRIYDLGIDVVSKYEKFMLYINEYNNLQYSKQKLNPKNEWMLLEIKQNYIAYRYKYLTNDKVILEKFLNLFINNTYEESIFCNNVKNINEIEIYLLNSILLHLYLQNYKNNKKNYHELIEKITENIRWNRRAQEMQRGRTYPLSRSFIRDYLKKTMNSDNFIKISDEINKIEEERNNFRDILNTINTISNIICKIGIRNSLSLDIGRWFSILEKDSKNSDLNKFLLRYLVEDEDIIKSFENNPDDIIKIIKRISQDQKENIEKNKEDIQLSINKMLERTFLKDKITINEDLYLISVNGDNNNIRASTSELRLIFFKKFLIDIFNSKETKKIDLLVLDDITSSMDYHLIDLIYNEITLFINDYRKLNPKFKIIFLTHSDAIFNYFASKEFKKQDWKTIKDIHFYTMYQNKKKNKENYEVLISEIKSDKVWKIHYKNINILLGDFYDKKIPNRLKPTIIRKIMENLAVIMTGTNNLSSFIISDMKTNKYYFETILGNIEISPEAHDMLNLESHMDINNFNSVESTIREKRNKVIKEFEQIFQHQLNFKYK